MQVDMTCYYVCATPKKIKTAQGPQQHELASREKTMSKVTLINLFCLVLKQHLCKHKVLKFDLLIIYPYKRVIMLVSVERVHTEMNLID